MNTANLVNVQNHNRETNRNVNQLKLVVNNMRIEEQSLIEKKKLIYDKPIFKAKKHDPY